MRAVSVNVCKHLHLKRSIDEKEETVRCLLENALERQNLQLHRLQQPRLDLPHQHRRPQVDRFSLKQLSVVILIDHPDRQYPEVELGERKDR
jgi:hypothetical protein